MRHFDVTLTVARINSQPLQHRLVKILPSKKVDSILKSISLNKRRIYL